MSVQNYGKVAVVKNKKLRRRITGIVIAVAVILAGAFVIGKLTENSAEYQLRASLVEENRMLREENADLKEQLEELQQENDGLRGDISEKDAYIGSIPTPVPEAATATPTEDPGGTTPRTQ